ncbi:MAG: GAF domain-containing protein [Anaerolineales bacterium]|nr:GAF domain-containing protein [Anaerolineales bacterium]
MNALPPTWRNYLSIETADPTAVRQGRLLQFCLALITAVLALRLSVRLIQTSATPLLPLALFVALIAYAGIIFLLVRRARLSLAAHLMLAPLILGDLSFMVTNPVRLWIHPLFILVFLATAVILLPLTQSWPYLLLTLGAGFYLESINQPGLFFNIAALTLTAVGWVVKRENTRAMLALNAASNSLTDLNETLQQRLDDQLADLRYRNERLEFSLDVMRTANASLELSVLLQNTINLIHNEFGFYHVSVFLTDPTNRFVSVAEATGNIGQQLKEETFRIAIGSQSIVGQATQRRQAQLAINTADDPYFQRHPNLPDTQSELALPLLARGYLVGALDVQSTDIDAFNTADITILQLMADQLANSIDNALLFGQLEKRTTQLAELQAITTLMTLQNNIQGTLNVLAERAKQLIGADGAGIFLWREETNKLELVLNVNMGSNMTGYTLNADEGLAGLSFREGETYVIDDYSTWPGRLDIFTQADFHALMTVPLKERDRAVGVLSLTRRTPDKSFDTDEIQIIELLAAQAGTIITNQELFEDLHVLVQRERVVNKITAEVRHSLNADTIVESAAQQLGEVLGNKQVRVRLYPPTERYVRAANKPTVTRNSAP